MAYTEEDEQRVYEEINRAVAKEMRSPSRLPQDEFMRHIARVALDAMERETLEDVLRVKNWKVTLAHSHTSDGVAIDDAWFAYVVDWHTGKHLAHENGATIDEAIRNAIAAAKGDE